ncbi:MAG: hypothetical protein PT944_01370 [Actinomycetaceae bacterium]|nr:hypothetical protein [Arcanobacterium sp.]MDD7686554.1 hypothetical protein [Actinomycetaceae bacterium]MDY5272834.1 hypothetical protein [Arcanobacterium sp.]
MSIIRVRRLWHIPAREAPLGLHTTRIVQLKRTAEAARFNTNDGLVTA